MTDQVDSAAPLNSTDRSIPYICCAADRTYGIGAIPDGLDADAPGAATTDPATLGIRTVADVFGTARYHWRFPTHGFINPTPFTEALAQFYETLATQNCPASVLVRLEDAVLANSIVYADASATPTIVYETFRPNDRAAVQIPDSATLLNADSDRFADSNWNNLFIGSAGSSNYGHWLVDDLPRLKAVATLMRISPRPVRVLIHSYGHSIDQIRIQSIRLFLGTSVHIDLLDPDKAYRFEKLYYSTPVSQHPVQKSPVAIDFVVREAVSRVFESGESPDGPTLLFVDRSSRYGRTLSNQTHVKELVERRGFTIVDPETMDFTTQVRLFANSQVVIGQMGAAMTNTLFCRPTTTLVYLAPSGWVEPFYWDLSVVRGHYYRVLFGDVTDSAVPSHRSDFTIDLGALERAIDAL